MTIGQIRGWAIARLGLTVEAFGLLRQGEYWEAMMVWIEDRNAERHHTAEVIRGAGLQIFNLLLPKGSSVKAHDFLPFPWDPEEQDGDDGGFSQMSAEEKKASLDALMKHVNW